MLIALLVAGCASPGAAREGRVRKRYRAAAGYGPTGLPASTRALLRERGWDKLPRDEAAVLFEAAASGDASLRLELAEFQFLSGEPNAAVHAARNAWLWMEHAKPRSGGAWARALRLYNAAVESHVLGGAPLPKEFEGVLAAWEVPDRGFRRRVTRAGIGAPVLVIRPHDDERDAEEPYWPPIDVGLARTAVLRFDGPRPVLRLLDPVLEEMTAAFGGELAVAADFTAPLAYLYAQVDDRSWQRESVRNPSFDDAGFVLIEPVRPDRIPVLFLHGLNANPADFRWMVNELRADPDIRRRYQFIAYRYPSTLPLPVLGLDLRDRMKRFWAWFDQRAPGARRDGYVIVGHSLGGLLAKTLAVRGGDRMFEAVFRVPREEVDFSGDLGEQLRRTLFLEPDPKLARVIFLAVPHKGSVWAEGGTAEAALNAVRLPPELATARDRMQKRWGTQLRPEVRRRLYSKQTAIQNLRSDDPYLIALSSLPIEVEFDSVIGNLLGTSVKPTTDGVVSYASAHLPGASSETIVRAHHEVQRTKLGIAAVRDILKRHGRRP